MKTTLEIETTLKMNMPSKMKMTTKVKTKEYDPKNENNLKMKTSSKWRQLQNEDNQYDDYDLNKHKICA